MKDQLSSPLPGSFIFSSDGSGNVQWIDTRYAVILLTGEMDTVTTTDGPGEIILLTVKRTYNLPQRP